MLLVAHLSNLTQFSASQPTTPCHTTPKVHTRALPLLSLRRCTMSPELRAGSYPSLVDQHTISFADGVRSVPCRKFVPARRALLPQAFRALQPEPLRLLSLQLRPDPILDAPVELVVDRNLSRREGRAGGDSSGNVPGALARGRRCSA